MKTDPFFFCLGMLNDYIGRMAYNANYIESFNSTSKAAIFENSLIRYLQENKIQIDFTKKIEWQHTSDMLVLITFESFEIAKLIEEYYEIHATTNPKFMSIKQHAIIDAGKMAQISYLKGAFERESYYDIDKKEFRFDFANSVVKFNLICDLLHFNQIWFNATKYAVPGSCPTVNEIIIKNEDAAMLSDY